MTDSEELLQIADKLDKKAVANLTEAAKRMKKSWCGSFLGYHSRIYYENFEPPPTGAHFSSEWRFTEFGSYFNGTTANWGECTFEGAVSVIYEWAGNPDEKKLKTAAQTAKSRIEKAQSQLLSILSRVRTQHIDDKFLEEIEKKIESESVFTHSGITRTFIADRQWVFRDSLALSQGLLIPPHLDVLAHATTGK